MCGEDRKIYSNFDFPSSTPSIDRDISFNIFFGERECFEISSKIVVFTFYVFQSKQGEEIQENIKMKK